MVDDEVKKPALPDNIETQPIDIMACPSPARGPGSTEGLCAPDPPATTAELREEYQQTSKGIPTLPMPGCGECLEQDLSASSKLESVLKEPLPSNPPGADHDKEDHEACMPHALTCFAHLHVRSFWSLPPFRGMIRSGASSQGAAWAAQIEENPKPSSKGCWEDGQAGPKQVRPEASEEPLLAAQV